MSEAPVKRRWLQFSLRTLLIFVTLLSIWSARYVHRVKAQQASLAMLKGIGRGAYYDYQISNGKPSLKTTSAVPKWLLDSVGVDYFHDIVRVVLGGQRFNDQQLAAEAMRNLNGFPSLSALILFYGSPATDDGLRYVGQLSRLETLLIYNTDVLTDPEIALTDKGIAQLSNLKRLKFFECSYSRTSDESLRILAALPRLEQITLHSNELSDQGLAYLKEMRQLTFLDVGPLSRVATKGRPGITDDGLAHLVNLTNLDTLRLVNTDVTTRGLEHLESLKNLKRLVLIHTKVTDTSALQKALPRLKIIR